jgi:hypothetical protein
MQTKLLINGKLTAGGGKVEDVLNPATGKVLARVAEQPIFVAAGNAVAVLAQLLDGLVPLGAAGAGAQRVGQQLEERVGFDRRGSWHGCGVRKVTASRRARALTAPPTRPAHPTSGRVA